MRTTSIFSNSSTEGHRISARLEGITKKFGKLTVFDNLNLEIGQGELFSLVGPSGSGKTTLLRIIAGLETQDSGHIYINSRAVDGLSPASRNIGMVFQDYALYPNKTVIDNIMSPLIVKNVKRRDARKKAEEIAERLSIAETLNRKPAQISGGQQQRVALARALIKEPDVFLLDEPFSNLDAQLRFSARKFLKEVQREFGITTIYVTHDQSEALSISDRVAIMGGGRVHQVGAPREIYASPSDEFVATFIGSPPLNVVSVQVREGNSSPIIMKLPGVSDGVFRIGIRPESVIIGKGSNEATVTALEYAGRETIVYLKVAELEMRSIIFDAGSLKVGQKVKFDVQQANPLILAKEGS